MSDSLSEFEQRIRERTRTARSELAGVFVDRSLMSRATIPSALRYAELRQDDRTVMTVHGVASAYGPVVSGSTFWGATFPEVYQRGAWAGVADEFLRSGFVGGLNHDWDRPVGVPVATFEEASRVLVSLELRPELMDANLVSMLTTGVVTGLSVGYQPGERELLTERAVGAYWREVGHDPTAEERRWVQEFDGAVVVRSIRRWYEVSPVVAPACGEARISRVQYGATVDRNARADRAEVRREVNRWVAHVSRRVGG